MAQTGWADHGPGQDPDQAEYRHPGPPRPPPRTSNGPAEAVNERLEHLHGIALGFRNLTRYTIPSLTHTDASKTT